MPNEKDSVKSPVDSVAIDSSSEYLLPPPVCLNLYKNPLNALNHLGDFDIKRKVIYYDVEKADYDVMDVEESSRRNFLM